MAIRTGSTKLMSSASPGVIRMRFENGWSVFDRGTSPQEIPGLGAARCACAVRSFEIHEENGFKTPFLNQVDRRTIEVQEFSIPGEDPLSGMVHGRVLPLEFITRDAVAGSLLGKLLDGRIRKTDLGFSHDAVVEKGTRLPYPRFECTTKFKPIDHPLAYVEAQVLAELSNGQWREVREMVLAASRVLNAAFEKAGFSRWDHKDEIALANDGGFRFVDAVTPDECRLVGIGDGEHYDKDLFRNYLRHLNEGSWKLELDEAQRLHPYDKTKWPEYPHVPEWLLELVLTRYRIVAHEYASVSL